MTDVVDLFAGPGGWDLAAEALGIDVLGIELDDHACATRRAAADRRVARLNTLQADVSATDPRFFSPAVGLIASPPCQTFSSAGKGAGRKALDEVLAELAHVAIDGTLSGRDLGDPRTALVVEPLRWARELRPEWIALEQVPSVLPVWEAIAEILRDWGYTAATAVVSAEQYGVPQTRKRAVLLASRVREVSIPAPTHRAYRKGVAQHEGDQSLRPWVSMAEALGWNSDDLVGFPRRDDGLDAIEINGEKYRARDLRSASEPAFAPTEKTRSWQRWAFCPTNVRPKSTLRLATEPAPTLAFGHDKPRWVFEAPATTVMGDPRIAPRGHHDRQFNGETVRVTAGEASVLQTFAGGYPWQGSKTRQFQQIGNAVPPLLAYPLLAEAAGIEHGQGV